MKKILMGIVLFLCTTFMFTSCLSFCLLELLSNDYETSFEILDDNILVSYNCYNIPECCKQYKFFTNVSFSSYFCDSNFLIGYDVDVFVKNSLTKPVRLDKLPNHLKSKGPILEYLPKKGIINYYIIISKSEISLYSFILEIDKDKLNNVSDATISYSKVMDNVHYWKGMTDKAVQPMIEKSREVPYTKYESVYKNGGYYQVPYTAYRIEEYMVPNPDYNPTLADEYTKKYIQWQEESFKYKEAAQQIDWYNLYLNTKEGTQQIDWDNLHLNALNDFINRTEE